MSAMAIEHWAVDPLTAQEAERNYRTAYALRLEGKPAIDIIRQLTFDGAAPGITIEDIDRLFTRIQRDFIRTSFAGIGIEVGSGPMVFGSVLARHPEVTKMYGVEVCAPIIERLYGPVSQEIAGDAANKTVGVVGSFDRMEVPSQSVDFVFDFFSLHHSLDIQVTLKEIARVLKPGGFLLMLDKARPDSFTDNDLQELMDAEYGPGYNRQFGLDPTVRLRRRDNGEREYRLKDWVASLNQAGFSRVDHWFVQRTVGGSPVWRALKHVLSMLPVAWQVRLSRFIPRSRKSHKFTLEESERVFLRELDSFRKEASLIVAYR